MAAEMSTGILCMGNIYKRNPAVSMLVLNKEAYFIKKQQAKFYLFVKMEIKFAEQLKKLFQQEMQLLLPAIQKASITIMKWLPNFG